MDMESELGFFNDSIDIEVELFLKNNKAKETVRKDKYDYNRFKVFVADVFPDYENVEIENIQDTVLDRILSSYFMYARKFNKSSEKYDGGLYQPDTLTSFHNTIQRVLMERGSKLDIKNDIKFEKSRRVLAAKRKELTKNGLGNKPNATRPLTDEEVNKLYEKGYFGLDSPVPLQRLMWWCLTTQFGYRARDETRKLLFGDIKLCRDEDGQKYLEWDTERGTKTRTGESSSHQRLFNPKAYASNSWQCPIRTYEAFVSHRPRDANHEDSPFYLTVKPQVHINSDVWFYPRPLGKNKIGSLLKNAAELLQTDTGKSRSKIANHSARKTSITKLLDNNVHPLNVSQLSGHKNIDSLKSYHSASLNEQKMSRILASDKGDSTSSVGEQVSTVVSKGDQVTTNAMLSSQSSISRYHGSTFQGASMTNCVFHVTVNNQNVSSPPKPKRKKYSFLSDDDE